MPAEQYHNDPCPTPALSSGIIKTLLNESPRHAYEKHPRLNAEFKREEKSAFDIGTVCHALLLQGINRMQVIEAPDWRTNHAKELRDLAREEGCIPILYKDSKNVIAMMEVARLAINDCDDFSGISLDDGVSETPMFWQEENGVWCKIMPDWRLSDNRILIDYKTTSGSSSPEKAARQIMEQLDGDIQAALYRRGVKKLTGVDAKFVFMVQETVAPYAVSFIGVSPTYLALGEDKVETAIALFGECLERNEWPGYERRINWVEPNNWTLEKWYQRQNEAKK